MVGSLRKALDAPGLDSPFAPAVPSGLPDGGVFDEAWYLDRYPDVAATLASQRMSATEHYLRLGREQGRLPRPIVHLHVPKTAGTSVRIALQGIAPRTARPNVNFEFDPAQHRKFDLFTGHFGYRVAAKMQGDIVTVLRDPIDRFLSYYYHCIQLHDSGEEVSERTVLAVKYGIDDYVHLWDCSHATEALFNAVTWQIAFGSRSSERKAFRNEHAPTDEVLLRIAMDNIDRFALVGIQEEMPQFWAGFEKRYGLKTSPKLEGATKVRRGRDEISTATRNRIYSWVYLDAELYRYARRKLGHS